MHIFPTNLEMHLIWTLFFYTIIYLMPFSWLTVKIKFKLFIPVSIVALHNDTFEMALIWNWITDLKIVFQIPTMVSTLIQSCTRTNTQLHVCSSKVYCHNSPNIIIRNINHLNGRSNCRPIFFFFNLDCGPSFKSECCIYSKTISNTLSDKRYKICTNTEYIYDTK